MQRELARILDANFNRAREGLRVAEEYARFVLEDRLLAGQARAFRHELADAARRLDPDGSMLDARDTAGDVGTLPEARSGVRPESAGEVAVAAAKRVGEALRALAEYAKPVSGEIAGRLDQVRYRFYDWEKHLAGSACRRRFVGVRLYLLLTQEHCRGGDWRSAVRAALDGGVDAIQLREKQLADGELLGRAGWLVEQCRSAGALSVINDRADIARIVNAGGVHVGQDDLPVAAVRKVIRPSQFVGASTHSMKELEGILGAAGPEGRGLEAVPDYVSLGPMFATSTKPEYAVAGPAYASQAIPRLDEANIPHVAVGGITPDNLGELVAAGVRRVAVCSAILGAADIASACATFRKHLR